MNKRSLLVVTYAFPPSPSVGALRWSLMTKYLERMGHDVTVIASDVFGGLPAEDPERVVRPWNLESSPGLRRLLRRPPVKSSSDQASREKGALDAVTTPFVPDPWVLSWTPFALREARRIAKGRKIDCVVTTSPPESTHLVGLGVRRLGPAWVADFRDGWIFEPAREPFPTGLQRTLDANLESRVVNGADVTVAVTEEYAADFRRRLGVDVVYVPNGWEPELAEDASRRDSRGLARGDKLRLVYTGRLGGRASRRRISERFLRAFERFSLEEPALAGRLELVLAGPSSGLEATASLEGRGLIRHVGQLERADSLLLQRSADVLLLIGSESAPAPAKLYEYLGARRPILYVGGSSPAARIVAETESGGVVADDDPDAIVEQLRRIARGEFGAGVTPHGAERYTYPRLAEEMAAAIEEAIRRRAASS